MKMLAPDVAFAAHGFSTERQFQTILDWRIAQPPR